MCKEIKRLINSLLVLFLLSSLTSVVYADNFILDNEKAPGLSFVVKTMYWDGDQKMSRVMAREIVNKTINGEKICHSTDWFHWPDFEVSEQHIPGSTIYTGKAKDSRAVYQLEMRVSGLVLVNMRDCK